MLIELAIGDAYGRPFEFNTKEYIHEKNNGKQYHLRDATDYIHYGKYTDDTQMSLGLALALIKNEEDLHILCKFWTALYNDDIHIGYSKRVRTILSELTIDDSNSNSYYKKFKLDDVVNSNGTMMRSVPIGVLPTVAQVLRYAQMQCVLTHSSFDASVSSQIIALLSHYFYYKLQDTDNTFFNFLLFAEKYGLKSNVIDCINSYENMMKEHKTILCDAKATTGAVLSLLFIKDELTMSEMLINAVNMSGDVDSICAVTLGIASLCNHYVNDLDLRLYRNLENNKYGKEFLIVTDNELFKKFPRPKN